jgi:hypothetical protein
MAKTIAPLFSLGASGQIGKTLVYMTWKGIKDVRQYVIPANPRTAGQQAQRSRFSDAVTAWHEDGYSAPDVSAWNRYATGSKIAASGFNMFTRFKVAGALALHTWTPLTKVITSAITTTGATVTVSTSADMTGKLFLGTSPTSLLVPFAGTFLVDHYTFTVTGLLPGTRYYFYVRNTSVGEAARTGVYELITPTA